MSLARCRRISTSSRTSCAVQAGVGPAGVDVVWKSVQAAPWMRHWVEHANKWDDSSSDGSSI
eukprot:365218-Chlamydomonas_euryale.AAC.8